MLVKTYNNRVFYALCIVDFLLRMEWGISTSMLTLYVHDLGGSPIEVSLVFSVFAGISIFCYPFWGSVSDYLGKRKLFIVAGMAALSPIFLLISLQRDVLLLILLRGSTAFFKGAVVPATLALVTDLSPPERVGGNIGVLGSIEMAGWAIGPIIGGYLSDTFGFPALWVFVAVECIAGALIFLFFGADPPTISRTSRKSLFEAFRTPTLISKISVVSVSFCIFLFGYSLLGPNLNVYLFQDLGFSRTLIGTVTFVGTVVTMVLQPAVGAYSDKIGRKPFFIFAALNLSIGNVVLYVTSNIPLTVVSQILIRNYSLFNIMGSAYIADVVHPTNKSAAIGFLNSMGALSRSIGAIIGGVFITLTSIKTLILLSVLFPVVSSVILLLFLHESKRQLST